MRLARESWLLAAICMMDLLTTLIFVNHRGAIEGNPIMGYFLALGVFAFVLAKLVLCMGPLAILEWARQRRPAFVKNMLRVAVALYLGFYGLGVWQLNQDPQVPPMSAAQVAAIERASANPTSDSDLAELRARMQIPQIRSN